MGENMTTKCVYCGEGISDGRSMEICDSCGFKVWGQKMFETIKRNTDDARDNEDLCMTNMNPKETSSVGKM